MTVLDHLILTFKKAAIYNRHDLARPTVVLWTDGERLWEKVAMSIAQARPGFFVLDESENTEFCGPAPWIRYQMGKWAGEEIPVVYLPGIARHQFRGAAGFPDVARHLYALQFQGQFCSQTNGKDWTPLALLSSEDGGFGLDLAKDKATLQALHDQLGAVLQTPASALTGRRLDASDFHDLAVSDHVGMVLQWMADPDKVKKEWSHEKHSALTAIGKKELDLDLAKDGVLVAAEKLVAASGKWSSVWNRFAEAPGSWRGVVKALDLVQPNDLFETTNLRIPATNRKFEDELRAVLLKIGELPASPANEKILHLAGLHAERGDSVWGALGEAPLAIACRHLGNMVAALQEGPVGSTCEALSDSYLAKSWKVDAEARRAWAAVRRTEDLAAVTAALRATYLPWLESLASRLQELEYPVKGPADSQTFTPEAGTVILFVDGFRADVAKELAHYLAAKDYTVQESPRWSALPTVTATAKPGWNPLAGSLTGKNPSENFQPTVEATDKLCGTVDFRKLSDSHGWPWIDPSEVGNPSSSGWTEVGSFDSLGHSQGAKLAWHINEELAGVVERLEALFEAGWKTIRVVTDHGWLWMPGGLPKVELPKHLTVSKWGRCARPDPKANHTLPQVPWFWANEQTIVLAPGIHVFKLGTEYTHGGLTLQEALTLSLTVSRPEDRITDEKIVIKSARWAGLRLNIQLSSAPNDVRLDIRSKAADPSSSLLDASQKAKYIGKDAKVTLLVEKDSLVGQAAILVAIRGETVLAKKNITIGEQ